jgi:Glycosyl hydrolases family 16
MRSLRSISLAVVVSLAACAPQSGDLSGDVGSDDGGAAAVAQSDAGGREGGAGDADAASGGGRSAVDAAGGDGGAPSASPAVFFDGFDTLDVTFDGSPSSWMDHYPFGGSEFTLPWNSEAEYLCDVGRDGYQPFSIKDGILTIAASKAANPKGLAWSSGTITSATEVNGEPSPGIFARTYGYFEMRAKLPAGPGFWPAFVLYPLTGAGEIDIFEVLGNDPTTLYFTLHATSGAGQRVVTIADSSAAFHTYGCDWQPDFVTLYVDGQRMAQMVTPADMKGKPYYVNIPFSVGGAGSWPGPTTAATPDPGYFAIDYVGVWTGFASAYPHG